MSSATSAHERITCREAHELGTQLQPLRLHGARRDLILHVSSCREVHLFVAVRGAALRDEIPDRDDLFAADRSFFDQRPLVIRDSRGNPSFALRFARVPLSDVEADRIAVWLEGAFGASR